MAKASPPAPDVNQVDGPPPAPAETAPAPLAPVDPFANLTAADADSFLPELNVSPAIATMVDALTPTTPKALPVDTLTPDLVKVLLKDVRAYAKRQGKKVTIRQGTLAGKVALKFSIPAPRQPKTSK